MAKIRTNPHRCDWSWSQPEVVEAPKRVVVTKGGTHYIVAITEYNPETAQCWMGVPAFLAGDGAWEEMPGVMAHSAIIMRRRDGLTFVD